MADCRAHGNGTMRVLEISRFGLFKALMPESTHWICWGRSLTADEPVQPEEPSLALLARTLSRIGRREFDLIVLPAIHPQHVDDQSRFKLMSKAMLRGAANVPAVATLLHRFGLRSSRYVVLDIHDDPRLCDTTLRLLPHCALYFKRELALDGPHSRPSAGKFKPLPLILPDESRIPPSREKDIDLVFAGRLCNDTRKRAAEAARGLAAQGVPRLRSGQAIAVSRLHGGPGQIMARALTGRSGLGLLPSLRGVSRRLRTAHQPSEVSTALVSRRRQALFLL